MDNPLSPEASDPSVPQTSLFIPPTSPSGLPLASAPEEYRNRSTGLVVFGIMQILLGCFALFFIPVALLGALMSRRMGGGMPASGIILSILSYSMMAATFLTLGIGSIRSRRWAWTLTLTLSWIWLVMGAVSTVFITAMLPKVFVAGFKTAAAANSDAPPMPTAFMAVFLTFIIAVCAFFMVVLPIIFVVFYRRQDVERTVKRRDPVTRWTDACPVPVLALSVLFFGGGVYSLLTSFTSPLLPFFGRYLTGLAGGIGLLLVGGFDGLVAYSLFRLRAAWWWIAVAAVVLRCASGIISLRGGNLLKAYARMGWSTQQLQILSANPLFASRLTAYWTAISGLLFLGYMIWVKRYFATQSAQAAETQVSLPSA